MRVKQLSVALVCTLMFYGCFVIHNMDGVSQSRELQKTGEAAQAKILQIWDTGMTENQNPIIGILLEVHPTNGEPYQAKTKCMISRLDIPQFQPGAVVPVRFDPKEPTRVSVDVYKY